MATMNAQDIIEELNLMRHPSGGWYVPNYRADNFGARSDITTIYYLLEGAELLPWRKLTAHEVWHFYDGAPVEMHIERTRLTDKESRILGRDLKAGQRPQIAVPAYYWQRARSLGVWSLVGCDVAPGFSQGQTQIVTEAT